MRTNRSRVVASGLTAAVTVAVVVAMADAEGIAEPDDTGTAVGAIAGYEGGVAFAELTAAADPGTPPPGRPRPPQLGVAGVS